MNTNSSFTDDGDKSYAGRADAGDTALPSTEGGERNVQMLAQQVIDGLKNLPQTIQTQLKENPYRLLGIAAGAGFGAGVLLGSRLMRTLVVTVGGYALSEAGRAFVADQLKNYGVEPPQQH